MFIAEIKITDFRIFQNFDLVLNPGMNLIVGENNSGKTALIDAIRYALDTNSAERISVSERDFHKDETHFNIQLKFEGITFEQASVFVEHLTHEPTGEGDNRKSVLYVNYEATLTDQIRRGYRLIKTDVKSGQNADGPRIEREIRNYLSATYLKPLRDAETEMAAGRGSRLSQILSVTVELSKEQGNFNALIQALVDANQEIIENPGVKRSRENIKERLSKLIFTNDQFNPTIDILGGKEVSGMSDTEKKRMFTSILEKLSLLLDPDNPLQGLGYNNLLFIATELLLLQQEKDEFHLLLIEEPEAHLHPQMQMRLLKFIRDEYSQKENPKLQSILTTHSPNLASKAPLERLILMSKDGKAFPLRKGETELENDDYEFLEKFLDVTKSNLFFAKAIIIVEGDGENILLPTIAELLGRPLENYGVSVVNMGNTAFARYAKIFKRKGLAADASKDKWIPIKVACLRDLDLWPDKAEDTTENEPFGFKNKLSPNENGKGGNLRYWKSTHNPKELQKIINSKNSPDGQNVKVCLSDEWTFEYSLALKGLAEEVYKSATGSQVGFDELPDDKEEKAIAIYKIIEEGKVKTETAYNLANMLINNYGKKNKRAELIRKLPQYVIDAIEYVTKPITLAPSIAIEDQEGEIADA